MTVSSPAMVPSTPSMGCLSMTLATYCAAPDGVCTTTRLRAAATDVTSFIAFGNIFSKNVHTPFKRS